MVSNSVDSFDVTMTSQTTPPSSSGQLNYTLIGSDTLALTVPSFEFNATEYETLDLCKYIIFFLLCMIFFRKCIWLICGICKIVRCEWHACAEGFIEFNATENDALDECKYKIFKRVHGWFLAQVCQGC